MVRLIVALVLNWKVMLVMAWPTVSSAPSALGVRVLFDEEPPLFEPVDVLQLKPPSTNPETDESL